jgi:hypothetical protein
MCWFASAPAQTPKPSSSPPARFSVKLTAQGDDAIPQEYPSEADPFYAGLPSTPRLVWRSGDSVWTAPTGPKAYHRRKVLRDVGEHPIKDVWEDNLALGIIEILKKTQVDWTSLNLVRIPYVDESPAQSPPSVIWIGVTPSSLSRDDAAHVSSLRGLPFSEQARRRRGPFPRVSCDACGWSQVPQAWPRFQPLADYSSSSEHQGKYTYPTDRIKTPRWSEGYNLPSPPPT